MRICLLSDQFPPQPGGLAVSAHRLASGLNATVCIVSENVVNRQAARDVHHVRRDEREDDTLAAWFDAVCHLHTQQPFDAIHAHYAVNAGFVGTYAARTLGIPAVVSVRGNDLDRSLFHPAKRSGILWALQHASAVATVTTEHQHKVQALAPKQRVTTIFNAVDAERFHPGVENVQLQADLNPDGAPLIGFVGEARIKKGIEPLLHALARVTQAIPHARLLLIGGVRRDAKAIFKAFTAAHPDVPVWEIRYLPHDLMPAVYHLLDVVVMPSLHDGMPNAILEAMACGRAVIGTRVGGMPDVIRDGVDGLLIPPGDVVKLANAIINLLNHPQHRDQLGTAARDRVLREFTPERELAAYRALYTALISSS